MLTNPIYLKYTYKQDLALNSLQVLVHDKTQRNKTKQTNKQTNEQANKQIKKNT